MSDCFYPGCKRPVRPNTKHCNKHAGEHAVAFIEQLKHTKGKWAGKPFKLMPWQKKIILDIFGNVNKDGFRIVRTAYIEIPKKNGKSELAAAVALYLLFADGEMGAEIYSAASDREQAAIVFNVACQMVEQNDDLYKSCRIIKSQKRIIVEQTNSFYHVLSADVDNKHGFNTHGVIFDELHTQPKRDLWEVLTEGSGAAREHMLTFAITTAGYDRESICWEQHQYAMQIINGIIEDPQFYPVIYGVPEEEDWELENNWIIGNPSIGEILKIEDFRSDFKKAKQVPAKQNIFRRLRLNQWTQQNVRWIDMTIWDAAAQKVDDRLLKHQKCYAGLDLSSVSDMSAFVAVFERVNSDILDVIAKIYCPEAKLTDDTNKYQSQYKIWAKQGVLTTTPGNAIDYAFIKRDIIEFASEYNLISMNIDRLFQGYQMSMELEDELSGTTEVATMGMGFMSMAQPMKTFESKVLKLEINHQGNPVLRWMMDNTVVKMDEAGNYKPDKRNSQGKIDGIVALVMAIDRWERDANISSVYESHGIRTL